MKNIPIKLEIEILKRSNQSARFISRVDNAPEQKVRFINPLNGEIWGFLVIDNSKRGPGVGGIRIAKDINLEEISRLAHLMTLKSSAACLPFGGGKSGIKLDTSLLVNEPNLKSEIINLFAEALYPFDNYISAPDMGTNEDDIQKIYEFNSKKLGTSLHSRGGLGRKNSNGGIPIDKWGLTAHGLVAAITKMQDIASDFKVNGARVIIQGFGNVGASMASKLVKKGAIIVGVSDINVGLWNSTGLNIEKLNNTRDTIGGLTNYDDKIEKIFMASQKDWLMEAPCDILIPAARPDAITARNADRIQCKLILQGANSPINKMTEYYLSHRRGIMSLSDFIVNSGGIIGCAVEHRMLTDEQYKKKVEAEGIQKYTENLITTTISNNISHIQLQVSEKKLEGTIFREEAILLAEKRLHESKDVWL